ncbi:MAG: hypothetical protein AAB401_13995, partial [Acidobacteriota bacterium]
LSLFSLSGKAQIVAARGITLFCSHFPPDIGARSRISSLLRLDPTTTSVVCADWFSDKLRA